MISPVRVYQWCNTALLAGIFLSLADNALPFDTAAALCPLTCAFFLLLLIGIQCAGKKGYIIGAASLLSLGVSSLAFLGPAAAFSLWTDCLLRILGRAPSLPETSLSDGIVRTALLTAGAFFIQAILERFCKAKTVMALLLAACLVLGTIAKVNLPGAGVCLSFVYLALVCAQYLQSRLPRKRKHSPGQCMAWLLPFFALYGLLLAVLPTRDVPYDWQWMQTLCETVRESVLTAVHSLPFGNPEDFTAGYTDFSQNASLLGNIEKKEREIMTLQAPRKLYTNLYLTGDIYDTFDGRTWLQKSAPPSYDRILDTLSALQACKSLRESYWTDYLHQTSLTIRYLDFRTRYLFAPSKTQTVTLQDRSLVPRTQQGRLEFEKRKSYGTEYTLDFYQMNTGQDAFYRLLEETMPLSADGQKQLSDSCASLGIRELSLQELSDYQAFIKETYGQTVPLPVSVSHWLSEVTDGCETDMEKLLAIEQALSSYTYHAAPGALPASVTDEGSFLTYFLGESRQGYCAHFASAFVLLARAEGIPARYVQGYLVAAKGKTKVTVTSGMAHAWPEVYVAGFGWIPFEPTPGYGRLGHAAWQMRQETPKSLSPNAAPATSVVPAPAPASPPEQSLPPETPKTPAALPGFLRRFAMLLPFLILLSVLLWFLEKKAAALTYRKLSPQEQFLHEMRQYLRLLSALSQQRKENETFAQFRQKALAALPDGQTLQSLIAYEEWLYADKLPGTDTLQKAREEKETLLCLLKQKNRWKYIRYWLQG